MSRDVAFEDQAEALIGVLKQFDQSKIGKRNALRQVVTVLMCVDLDAREDALTAARERIDGLLPDAQHHCIDGFETAQQRALAEIDAMLREFST